MIEDAELLRRYAEENSEAAFAELVRRRVGLVYAVALRRTGGDTGAAEDATQRVFCDLARKAHELSRRPVLASWLHRSARFAAADVARAERRRQARELEAQRMDEIEREASEPEWERLRPALDELLHEMEERDRDAVMLRFFDGRPFGEIGARLRLSENAARMRVERALEKLRARLGRRGVHSTAAALGLALAQQAGGVVPAGLAASVTGAALASGAGTAAGIGLFMGMTKLQIGIVAAVTVAGGAGLATQAETTAELRREVAAMEAQRPAMAELRAENERLARAAAEVEMLRRDDGELKRLAQGVAEAQQAAAEKARQAQVRAAQSKRTQLEAEIREKDRLAQVEIDRMNREGNVLVGQYKALTAQRTDPALTTEMRAQLETAIKDKLGEIQAKQREIKGFIEETRRKLMEESGGLASLPPDPAAPPKTLEDEARRRLQLRREWNAATEAAGGIPVDTSVRVEVKGVPSMAPSVPGEVKTGPAR